MPSSTLKCPFCPLHPQSYVYLKHILSQHREQLLSYGKNKEKLAYYLANKSDEPFSFYLPNAQENYCCLGCKTACVKKASAEKHFPKHKADHKSFLSSLIKEAGEVQTECFEVAAPSENKFMVARSLRNTENQFRSLQAELKTLQKKMNRLLQEKKITEEDLEDISDAEDDEEDHYRIVEENSAIYKQTWKWLEQKHVENPRLLQEN